MPVSILFKGLMRALIISKGMLRIKFFIIGLFCVMSFSLSAHTIKGVVIDNDTKEPLTGAAVLVNGGKHSTITDIDGNFRISTELESAQLVVSYVGYSSKTIGWNKDMQELTVALVNSIQDLDEVVVIGYGVQKKSDLTGSISSIDADDVSAMPVTNVVQALQGRAPGVEVVQNSGAPGSSTSIRIRGMGTINNSDPLYVVDGMPMDNIDFISPDDIASIEILKDASSAAIYGSRAANGVVLITTKDGSKSKKRFNINFSSYVGFQEAAKKPSILSKEEFVFFEDYVDNQYSKTMKDESGALVLNPEFSGLVENGEDWWDEIYNPAAPMFKTTLSIYGGTDKLNYYLSGNWTNTEGIVKESGYDRKSFNSKLNVKLLDNLSLGTNLSYTHVDTRVVPEGSWSTIKSAINFNPLTPVFDTSGGYTWGTPVEQLRRASYDKFNDNVIGQLNLNWQIIKELNFTSRASYAYYATDIDQFNRYNANPEAVGTIKYDVTRNPTTTKNFSWDNILTYIDSFGNHNLNIMVGQTMETQTYENNSFSGTGYGGYDDWYDSLSFANFSKNGTGYSTGWTALGILGRLSYDYAGRYLFQANFRADASSRFAKNNRWGIFPSASLGWKINEEAFLKDVDWISLLKLRAGWGQLGNNRISNFEYMSLVGLTGSNNYIYGVGTPSITPGMSIVQYGNPDILWERTESWSAGIDFNLWNNKITSSFEYFVKDTRDMLIQVPIVYSAGYPNTPMQNAGSVRNKGFEIQVSYRDNYGDFRYEIGGNISHVKNNILSLGAVGEPILGGNLGNPTPLGYVNRTVLNAPIACFYGWKTDGVLQASDFDEEGNVLVPVFASTRKYNPGDMKFVDINGDNVIDDNDRTFIGSPHPDFYYGLNIELGYKGFDLSMMFQGVAGNELYNVMKYFQYSSVNQNGAFTGTSITNVAADYYNKVYRPVGDPNNPTYRDNWGPNLTGTVPAPSSDQARNEVNFRNSDFYIEDGSYFRLKNIQLSYTFSKDFCKRSSIQGLKLYVSASNLFTITKYTGLDPEVGKRIGTESNNLFIGIDEGNYPQSRSYMFGVVFDF